MAVGAGDTDGWYMAVGAGEEALYKSAAEGGLLCAARGSGEGMRKVDCSFKGDVLSEFGAFAVFMLE
jgi:hypothetical protein